MSDQSEVSRMQIGPATQYALKILAQKSLDFSLRVEAAYRAMLVEQESIATEPPHPFEPLNRRLK